MLRFFLDCEVCIDLKNPLSDKKTLKLHKKIYIFCCIICTFELK